MYNQFLHYPAALVLIALIVCSSAYAAFSEWLDARPATPAPAEKTDAEREAEKELRADVRELESRVDKLMLGQGFRP